MRWQALVVDVVERAAEVKWQWVRRGKAEPGAVDSN